MHLCQGGILWVGTLLGRDELDAGLQLGHYDLGLFDDSPVRISSVQVSVVQLINDRLAPIAGGFL